MARDPSAFATSTSVFRPSLTSTNGFAFQGAQIANLFQQYRKHLSPRVGVSYSATPTTVVRAGLGCGKQAVDLPAGGTKIHPSFNLGLA